MSRIPTINTPRTTPSAFRYSMVGSNSSSSISIGGRTPTPLTRQQQLQQQQQTQQPSTTDLNNSGSTPSSPFVGSPLSSSWQQDAENFSLFDGDQFEDHNTNYSSSAPVSPAMSASSSRIFLQGQRPRQKGDFCHVCVRMRPMNETEVYSNSACAWEVDENDKKIGVSFDFLQSTRKQYVEYRYDHVLSGSDNLPVYQSSIRPLVEHVMEGYHGTVFAYGQTASGKTYTMMGCEEQPGVIPQAIHHVFEYIRESGEGREFLLRVSYLEIYNETLRDLLSPQTPELRIHEDKRRGVYVSPLKEEIVTSAKQVLQTLQRGEQNRHFDEKKLSKEPLTHNRLIESRERSMSGSNSPTGSVTGRGRVTVSQLNLIDLAGSEKAASDLERRKEGGYINRSLLTLGNVISRLTEEKTGHIPYRDSKLTRILQTSLAGNAKIAVICTISPSHHNFEESNNTLKFAARVKKIVTRANQNQIIDDKALIQKYRIEIAELKAQLEETNKAFEREREIIEMVKEERIRYEEEIAEQDIARTKLLERIDHLTKLILTNGTVSNTSRILEWRSMPEGGNRNLVELEGLLPKEIELRSPGSAGSAPGTGDKTSFQFFKEDELQTQRRENTSLMNKVRHLQGSLAMIKEHLTEEGKRKFQDMERDMGQEIKSYEALQTELSQLRDRSSNDQVLKLEATVSELREVLHNLEHENQELRAGLEELWERRNFSDTMERDQTSMSSSRRTSETRAMSPSKLTYLERRKSTSGSISEDPTQPPQLDIPSPSIPNVPQPSAALPTAAVAATSASSGVSPWSSVAAELEQQLIQERKLRAEENKRNTEKIASLEAELTICRMEMNMQGLMTDLGLGGGDGVMLQPGD